MKKIILSLFLISSFGFSLELQKVDIKELSKECLKESNPNSCFKVGKYKVSKHNIISAYSYLDKGCSLNNYTSCTLMGSLLMKSKLQGQQFKGVSYLSKACKEGNEKNACKILTTIAENSVEKLQEKCDSKDSIACLEVAKLYLKENEAGIKNAMDSLNKACSLGNEKGCATLSGMVETINTNISHIKGKDTYLKELGINKYFK